MNGLSAGELLVATGVGAGGQTINSSIISNADGVASVPFNPASSSLRERPPALRSIALEAQGSSGVGAEA